MELLVVICFHFPVTAFSRTRVYLRTPFMNVFVYEVCSWSCFVLCDHFEQTNCTNKLTKVKSYDSFCLSILGFFLYGIVDPLSSTMPKLLDLVRQITSQYFFLPAVFCLR
jgi:hypothetical protein